MASPTLRRRSIAALLILTGFFLTNGFIIRRIVTRTTTSRPVVWRAAAPDDTDTATTTTTTDDDLYFAHPIEPVSSPVTEAHDGPKQQSADSPNVKLHHQQPQERLHIAPKRMQVSPTKDEEAFISDGGISSSSSRREWLQRVAAVTIGGVLIGGGTLSNTLNKELTKTASQPQRLAPINLTAVAKETDVNVTLECRVSCVSLDTTTFQKKRSIKLPDWFPPYLVPEPKVIKDIPNSEVWTAAITAGACVEMARTSLLYPLLTIKNRIQNDVNHRYKTRTKKLHLLKRLRILQLTAKRHIDEGNLYAGIIPLLAVAAPATGVYYGTRDLTKRMIAMSPLSLSSTSVETAVLCAFVADVASLMIRTPADALATRLQVATGEESHRHHGHHHHDNNNSTVSTDGVNDIVEDDDEDDESEAEAIIEAKVGNWFVESIERLPAVILTDLPYLLSRIAIKKALLNGEIDIGRYELAAISIALLCAFLTTPFDVARTRILLDSDDDPETGIDGGSGEGLLRTMKTIMSEGDGGIENLFAGWIERTLYLGIGRAWLEPFQLVGYTAIRDAILLEAFD